MLPRTTCGAEATGNGCYYACYLYNCVGSSNPRSQFANNCITTGNETSSAAYYALYMYNSGLVDIYNNSFNRYGNNSSYGVYIYQGGAMNLVNNSVTQSWVAGYAAVCQWCVLRSTLVITTTIYYCIWCSLSTSVLLSTIH